MKKRRVSWEMPEGLLEDLENAKWSLRMSKSEIIREAIKEYIDRHVEGKEAGEKEEKFTKEESKRFIEDIKGNVKSLKNVRGGLKGRRK
ncbi:MAG: ribbon-helix-helix protein, CopG family [Planctomycetota bacterium]